jgi:hypothetical protein
VWDIVSAIGVVLSFVISRRARLSSSAIVPAPVGACEKLRLIPSAAVVIR